MTTPAFENVVKSIEELRALVGEPSELALKKQIGALDEHCRAFIRHSPIVRGTVAWTACAISWRIHTSA